MSRSLIVLPDESAKPILDAIRDAKTSLRVKMFAFSDPNLLKAVVEAHRRGVKVKVMLNPARRDGEDDNKLARRTLQDAGVEFKGSNPAFAVTHEKSMVVDDETAFVKSLNWVTENLTETRDYAISTTHDEEVDEIIECFEADWHRKKFKPSNGRLIWCPNDGRERLAAFIDDAKHDLFVQNERYQDTIIIERLVRAKERGVKVHVMARPPHTVKKDKLIEGVGGMRIMKDVGIKIHKLKHLKLHAKMLLADHSRAIIGSINLAPGSFDERRELAIEIHEDAIVDRLHKIARHDWEHSHKLDLSDEGIEQDLSKHGRSSKRLALTLDDEDDGKKKKKKHKK